MPVYSRLQQVLSGSLAFDGIRLPNFFQNLLLLKIIVCSADTVENSKTNVYNFLRLSIANFPESAIDMIMKFKEPNRPLK